jgi:hypothetical protein
VHPTTAAAMGPLDPACSATEDCVVLGGCHGIVLLPRAALGGYLRGCMFMTVLSAALGLAALLVALIAE